MNTNEKETINANSARLWAQRNYITNKEEDINEARKSMGLSLWKIVPGAIAKTGEKR